MANVLKVLGAELTLATDSSNAISNATLVRLLNTSNTTAVVITVQDSAGSANLASFTLNHSGSDESVVYLKKESTEKILVGANSIIKAVAVGYY